MPLFFDTASLTFTEGGLIRITGVVAMTVCEMDTAPYAALGCHE